MGAPGAAGAQEPEATLPRRRSRRRAYKGGGARKRGDPTARPRKGHCRATYKQHFLRGRLHLPDKNKKHYSGPTKLRIEQGQIVPRHQHQKKRATVSLTERGESVSEQSPLGSLCSGPHMFRVSFEKHILGDSTKPPSSAL